MTANDHASIVSWRAPGIKPEVERGRPFIRPATVPLCPWIMARHLSNYHSAVVAAIRARSDIDSIAAIVDGFVALSTGADGIPKDWRADREGVEF
jgi:ADP-ribosylglycohydrolase